MIDLQFFHQDKAFDRHPIQYGHVEAFLPSRQSPAAFEGPSNKHKLLRGEFEANHLVGPSQYGAQTNVLDTPSKAPP